LWVRAPPGARRVNESNFSEVYERVLVPSLFRPWAIDLLDRARHAHEERVLDVACAQLGTGSPTTGVDVIPETIAIARSIEPSVSWQLGNAVDLPFENRSFDVSSISKACNSSPIGRPPRERCDVFSRRVAESP
jgi:ubiquinone/menaquinone biosynthesis C-methylase UbiE